MSTAPHEVATPSASPPSGSSLATFRTRRANLDGIFRGLNSGAGIILIGLVAGIAIFLIAQALPSLAQNGANFLTSSQWDVADPDNLNFGIAQLLWVTVIAATIAMIIALPLSIALALFLTEYAPTKLAKPFAYLIDLLAAVPSIVFGLWGIRALAPVILPLQDFLKSTLGWIPFFEPTSVQSGTIFLAALVLSIMILPIMTALIREVFAQTPRAHKEAALALGATRFEMVRTAILPYGTSGVVSAAMLGLGRALGETIAISLILSTTTGAFSWSMFFGGETFASKIANAAAEFDSPQKTGAYIAAGLILFALTFLVNAAARAIIRRRKVAV